MKIKIGFSPCPNDTFIFDALIHSKIDTEGLEFEPVLEDVETLNQWALEEKLPITKLSFPAFFSALPHYKLLDAGSALGKGVGPLLVTTKNWQDDFTSVPTQTVALPGFNTTAHLLFSIAFPSAQQKKFMLFSSIEEAVIQGETALGVLIHENRFTYEQKGLKKLMDLGAHWEETRKVPIPLGGIAIHQSLSGVIAQKVQRLIRKSLEYAWSTYPTLPEFVVNHAQAMQEEVMRQHIQLYVNDYSLSLQQDGRNAIEVLFDTYKKLKGTSDFTSEKSLFI